MHWQWKHFMLYKCSTWENILIFKVRCLGHVMVFVIHKKSFLMMGITFFIYLFYHTLQKTTRGIHWNVEKSTKLIINNWIKKAHVLCCFIEKRLHTLLICLQLEKELLLLCLCFNFQNLLHVHFFFRLLIHYLNAIIVINSNFISMIIVAALT